MKRLSGLALGLMVACGVPQAASAVPIKTASASWASGGVEHEYRLYFDPFVSWEDARTWVDANLPGHHLVTITEAAEQAFLDAFVFPHGDGSEYWFGGYQDPLDTLQADANWTWVTGEAWLYTNWEGEEPNDTLGPGGEQYLAGGNWGWNDEWDVTNISGFVAERTSAVPEPGTLVLLGGGLAGLAGGVRRRKR